jgi:flagellar protein FlaI
MKILDNYSIYFENTKVPVIIHRDLKSLKNIYNIDIFDVTQETQIFLSKIKEDIEREGIFENNVEEVSYGDLKTLYIEKTNELLEYYFPRINIESKDKLITYLVQKNIDLGFIDILLSDENLEEVTINGSTENVMVYHRKFGWLTTNLNFESDEQIKSLISRIALANKKNFSNLNPLLDAHLLKGHRVNATSSGISTQGSTITIRRFSDDPWTVSQLIQSSTSTPEILAYIWEAMENELSMIIAGGTGSGKTSYLNAISSFIPKDQRIISVEDTREIRLSKDCHWVPMESRQKNQEGLGEVTILDLIINSLRMRPDRIIIGEIRKQDEAQVLFEAMRTGHSVYGTFHANTSDETILRLTSKPIEIPKITLNAISFIVVQHRDRKTGKRYTLQLSEVDRKGNENIIFQYQPKLKKYIKKNEPINILKKLEDFNGITKDEFYHNIKEKMIILNFMTKFKILKVDKVSKIINLYYKDKNILFDYINRHSNKNILTK